MLAIFSQILQIYLKKDIIFIIYLNFHEEFMFKKGNMKYHRLGNAGLLVSSISFGFWTNMDSTIDQNSQLVKKCLQNGINYFDTAQIYHNGQHEEHLGEVFKKLNENRSNYVISTKIWTAKDPALNSTSSTNRKHIRQSILQSLKRLQMDYVDIVYAHSYDENTPLEEICRAFNQIIEQGHSFYWGTSNWDADKVYEAFQICEKYNLHKPIAAQNQYNMINRKQIQEEYRTLFQNYRYGLVAYSPLLGGYLTGKYLEQGKEQGRFSAQKTSGWSKQSLSEVYYFGLNRAEVDESLKKLKDIAEKELNCKLTHLAIAWVLKFKHTSAALVGARNGQQLEDILKSLEVADKLTPQVEGKINKILNTQPGQRMHWKSFTPQPHLRPYN